MALRDGILELMKKREKAETELIHRAIHTHVSLTMASTGCTKSLFSLGLMLMLYMTPRAVTRWPLCKGISGDDQWVHERSTVLGSVELRKTVYGRRACQPVLDLREMLNPPAKPTLFACPEDWRMVMLTFEAR